MCLPIPDRREDEVSFKQAGSFFPHWALKGIGCVVKTPPTRKSLKVIGAVTVGTSNLNVEFQKALNPREDGITRGGRSFMINDKVMQIRNNYDKDVFNGNIGRISKIDSVNQESNRCPD
jgi:ATP-dependent exoDNAse (exonuclease V) alpha subunit